ncbi:digeranylgeranylglycerophospholipid reductase [Methanomicrobium sp. W14]|jgi:digeranylgeranylglycerophospholipid reductase|uniref:NAD(P)/FAD-dependent oxidoreductase n=1 Tax=Methanomicrobium sp. W14 TaxID=2817839 RepID=UPI001AE70705|nr:NAD(P)/FAD-dependent oxidoreductase [Methanomicrobium sp. W14]MBP2132117.1 digeranylgeranylglycerophospholipid reductase [Methanomicrobium sp. W14]
MKSRYDVLVIGGGPGGAVAAEKAAAEGLSVCLAEKRPAIGTPVRCAEGIGKEALKKFIDPDPCFISAEISRAAITAPDGESMILDSSKCGNKIGYVVERKIFDRELVRQAADSGADILLKTNAKAPVIENGFIKGAYLEGMADKISADVVIAADGVESRFSRMCGINTLVSPREMMSGAQYLLAGIDIEPDMNIFNVGNSVAPKGYLWVFPKGESIANVGVGIQGLKSGEGHRAKDYLDNFVRKKFPGGKIIEFITGGVPVCRPLPETAADGLMVVGDAARVVEPLTGGGIYNAMYTGELAAKVAVDSISGEDYSRDSLGKYDSLWRSSPMGKSLEQNYLMKEYFVTLSDEKLNRLIHSASKIALKDFSVIQLVKELVLRNPELIIELRSAGIFMN